MIRIHASGDRDRSRGIAGVFRVPPTCAPIIATILCFVAGVHCARPRNLYIVTDWGGERVVLHGRLVAPDGSPVSGAQVQIITPSNPHNPSRPIADTRSNADGTFVLPRVQSGAVDAVVVRGNGASRTFDRTLPRSARGRVSLGTFVIGPERDVPFRIHCRGPILPDPDQSDRALVRVNTWQMPSDEHIVSGYLGESPRWPDDDTLPGRDRTVRSFELTQRELSRTFRLPVGTNIVIVEGSCGNSVTTFEVPPSGPVVFEQDLPIAGHDSDVVLEIETGLACPVQTSVYVAQARGNVIYSAGGGAIECGQQVRISRLPPTRVSLSGPWGRCESIPLSPGETTRIVIGRGSCRAQRESAPARR